MTTTKDTKKLNPIEKAKAQKHPLLLKQELEHFTQIGWEAMDEFERDHGLKWLGFFYRPVTPGKFMLRMRIPHGLLSSSQMRVLGEIVQRYGHAAGFQQEATQTSPLGKTSKSEAFILKI